MSRLHSDHAAERERFVEDLLAIMTVQEKVGQLVLEPAPDSSDQASIRHIRDQLRRGELGGVISSESSGDLGNLQRIAIEETRLGIPLLVASEKGRGDKVVMPGPFALSASWSAQIAERAARIIAAEAREAGRNWLLGPDITLTNSQSDKFIASSWGASGMLAQSLASATIRGLQTKDEDGRSLLACLRVDDPSWTGRRDAQRFVDKLRLVSGILRDTPPRSAALDPATQDAFDIGAATDDPQLEISGPGGFEGIDLSEWADIAKAAGQAVTRAPCEGISVGAVVAAVKDGRISAIKLDDVVRKVVGAKFDLGLFGEDGVGTQGFAASPSPEAAETVALDAARHSIVLLRNDPVLLPLNIDSQEILVVGLAASDRTLPTGESSAEGASLIDGLDALGVKHKYVPGLALRHGQGQSRAHDGQLVNADRMAIGMASEAARRSRTVIVALGEMQALGEAQSTLLETLWAANRNLILVTLGSRPLDPEISGTKLPCVLHAGQLGTMSGHAIAEVLTGEFAPRGRLPVSLVDKGRKGLSLGHGLGYSEFGLGETSVELGHDRVVLSTVLHNVGSREGTETVQVYIRRPEGRILGRSDLVDFQRVSLVAGESRRLLFEIDGNQLGQYERDGSFAIDAGTYEIAVGVSEARAHTMEISVPREVTEIMARVRNAEPLPALFGKLRSVN